VWNCVYMFSSQVSGEPQNVERVGQFSFGTWPSASFLSPYS